MRNTIKTAIFGILVLGASLAAPSSIAAPGATSLGLADNLCITIALIFKTVAFCPGA